MTQGESTQIGRLMEKAETSVTAIAALNGKVDALLSGMAVLEERSAHGHTPQDCPIGATVENHEDLIGDLQQARWLATGGGRVIIWALTFISGGSILGLAVVIYWLMRLGQMIRGGGG